MNEIIPLGIRAKLDRVRCCTQQRAAIQCDASSRHLVKAAEASSRRVVGIIIDASDGGRGDVTETTIARTAIEAIVAHARESAPVECCGLLIGSAGTVNEAARARNIADRPTR